MAKAQASDHGSIHDVRLSLYRLKGSCYRRMGNSDLLNYILWRYYLISAKLNGVSGVRGSPSKTLRSFPSTAFTFVCFHTLIIQPSNSHSHNKLFQNLATHYNAIGPTGALRITIVERMLRKIVIEASRYVLPNTFHG